MKIILSHPTGNANVRAVARGFVDAGVLHKFYTSIATFPGDILYGMGRISPLSDFRRRSYDLQLKEYIKTYGAYEVGRLLSSKLKLKSLTKHETGRFSVDSVYRNLDKRVAQDLEKQLKYNINAVYAYEDGALETFKEAKLKGLNCFYDLPIGYWRAARKLMQEEIERNPLWKDTIGIFNDSDEKLSCKDSELDYSDCIFAASSFTAKTLEYYPNKLPEVHVIPYGFPTPIDRRDYRSVNNRKLKLLFVGGLSQRKGLANVFQVVESLSDKVDLTIVGRRSVLDCDILNKKIAQYKWYESLSHADVLAVMREHDVLLFPSLFEGFGLVITEAMSQGTPVITTDRTIGPDIIDTGENGWIVEAGSSESLRYQIEQILSNPEQIKKNGNAALAKAASWSWIDYQRELVRIVRTYGI